jgi:multiple sugar transport system permease protein
MAQRRRISRNQISENFWGYLFILPNLIGFLVFTLGSVIFSFTMSLTNWNLLRGFEKAQLIWFENYRKIFAASDFWISLRNNATLLLVVPISIALAVVLAAVMNQGVYGRGGARTFYFLPYVTNVVAVSTVWRALLHPTKGPINMFLKMLGVAEESLPGWLSSSKWFIPSIMLIIIWQNLGYYILMYSAGLQNIPQDYYEAASIDGGNAVHKFWYITLPMLTPITFVVAILGVIANLQIWSIVQVLTPGGSGFGSASYTLSFYIYRTSFIDYRSGYGAALSWVLCALTLFITLIQWRGQKKWVNY